MLAQVAYICCAMTSGVAAVLLLRSYAGNRSRLLLWSGMCFLALMLENIVIFVDLVVTGPHIDLRIVRLGCGLAGLFCLLFGLIWEAEK